ncbi:CsiV family protein [Alteromonas gilva]|uniref:CsiV family protein n=1 Tax=Alteromonas gilva TaxID=2987522 RepID=A0ABT5L2Y0_9ALTE|nr:CsiV family protein [Alteromonas gilva]MDC8831408.1 CsiV family protein [Alteromonas gilva]
MRRIISSLLTLSVITATPVLAQDDTDKWWFDIEVVLFARDTSVSDVAELFEQQSQLTAPDTDWDLLSDYYQPDITMVYNSLPVCNAPASPLWADKPTLDEIITRYTLPDEPGSEEPVSEELSATLADTTDETATADSLEAGQTSNSAAVAALPGDTAVNTNAYSTAYIPAQTEYTVTTDVTVPGTNTTLLTASDETTPVTPAPEAEPLPAPPPSPAKIAGYWLSYVLNDAQLTPFAVPDRQLDCVESRQPVLVTNLNTTSDWHWQQADLRIPVRQQTPLTIEGADWQRANGPHLLPGSALTQDELFTSIRWRKGLQRLAHFSWRQQVKFGQDKAETLRVFAGQNYANQFNQSGEQLAADTPSASAPEVASAAPDAQDTPPPVPTDTFFSELNKRLANPQPISFASMMTPPEPDIADIIAGSQKEPAPIWELDGFIQIYLKYLNNVPYLHINSELFYRQPLLTGTTVAGDGFATTTPTYELVSVPFKQLRRVISTQLHYFDHPLFGMVVQIRRYDRPPAPQPTASQDKN